MVTVFLLSGYGEGNTPAIVQKARMKDFFKKQTTWTPEAIQKEPYLYLTSQIEECDKAKNKDGSCTYSVGSYANICDASCY